MKYSMVALAVLCCMGMSAGNDSTTISLGGGVNMTFILIPAGSFTMGSPTSEVGRQPAGALWPGADHTDETQHQVTITRPFYLGKYEVKQAQWQAIKGNTTYNGYGQLVGGSEGANFPAHTLAWDDAHDFCVRLSQSSGMTIRLPTESEWEYACRAGTTTEWFWGSSSAQMDTYAISHSNNLMSTYHYGKGYTGGPPVTGLLQPNPWGLFDILGDISEWTADWYGDYPAGPINDPTGPATGTYKVARGANYDYGPDGIRTALRDPQLLNLATDLRWFYGLRVVMEAAGTAVLGRREAIAAQAFTLDISGMHSLTLGSSAGSRGDASLKICDPTGKLVRVIAASGQRAAWDCRDLAGRHVAAGTYIVSLRAGGKTIDSRSFLVR
jgi:formylglycine-generating enzyme required for sulfatase activity